MDWRAVARKSEGLHSADSFAQKLGLRRSTAILYLHHLRRQGFVKTQRGRRGRRLYDISPLQLRPVGSPGFLDIINKHASVTVVGPCPLRVYGRSLTLEEAIPEAAATRDWRIIRAALESMKAVRRWDLLVKAAREHQVERQVGALYTLARQLYRIRPMDKQLLVRLRKAPLKDPYLAPPLKSRDFADIESEWGVHIPFNKSELN